MTVTEHATLADYLTEILHEVEPLQPLRLSLLDAVGSRLATDTCTNAPLPAFDISVVNGYAVRSEDVRNAEVASAVTLNVLGDIGLGSWQLRGLPPRASFAISAGAPLPGGADAVVPAEHTDGGLVNVRVMRGVRADENVLWAGSERPVNAVIGTASQLVTPALAGLLASAGFSHVPAYPIPRVVVLSVGDELVDLGYPGSPGHVVDAASYAVTAGAQVAGAQAFRLGTIGDDPERLNAVLEDNAMRADLLIVTGMTLRRTVGQLFSQVHFVRLPVVPGGVFGFGRIGADETPLICLSGEAASAFVGFELVARPLIQRLAGARQVFRAAVSATLAEAVASPAGKQEFRPCVVSQRRGGGYAARPLIGSAHTMSGFAAANGLMVLGDHLSNVSPGTAIDVLLLDGEPVRP